MPVTRYIWDPISDNILTEIDDASATSIRYASEPGSFGQLISQQSNGETYWPHHDGQGNTCVVTDQNANVVEAATYSAFGVAVEKTSAISNPFGFKGALGYYANIPTQNIYVRARTYEGLVGRWLTPDPVPFVGEPNVYVYAWPNPINHSDPSGEWPLCNSEFCSIQGPIGNFEGIYGVRAEIVTPPQRCCDEATIAFHWKESHSLPNWYKNRAGRSGCGEPANREFENGFLWPFRFGNITQRGCSAPRAKFKKLNRCWVVQVDWECNISCSGACTCSGNCEPSLSSLGIYPNAWFGGVRRDGFSIRVDTSITFDEEFCVLFGCSLKTVFEWRRPNGAVQLAPPGDCQQRDIQFLWNMV